MNHDVFISYSSKNSAAAQAICHELEDNNIKCWMAPRDIPVGAKYASVITQAIKECKAVVLVFSEYSAISPWVESEINIAFSNRRPIVPYKIDTTPLENYDEFYLMLNNRHWIEAYPDFKTRFANLVTVISNLVGAKTSNVTKPTPAPAKTDKVGDYYNDGVREEAERKAREEAERRAREEAERKAREEAARKASEEAERKAREEAERRAREEAERKAREEAERRAREEAKRRAREEAERRRRLGIYAVGDYYNDGVREGVVFEVSADGRHGKIVSMKRSAEILQWSSDETEKKRLIGADSEIDGAANMAKVAAIYGWRDKYPAFKWCADLGEGWYLPSIEELKVFALNTAVYNAVNRTLIARGGTKLYDEGERGWYWSSTEDNYKFSSGEFCAWSVYMPIGYTYHDSRGTNHYVRAVATFGEDILKDDFRAFVEKKRKAREEAERKAREAAERRRRLGIYRVGDYYNDGVREGVVFEVSADGRHGKIVSMKQSAGHLQWSIDWYEMEYLIGADSETDGAANMAKVKAISGWREKYPAFAWCADLGEGWYLPSKEELHTIYKNKDKLNSNLTDKLSTDSDYWSSTEDDCQYDGYSCAWYIEMSDGQAWTMSKDSDGYVRAVSAF